MMRVGTVAIFMAVVLLGAGCLGAPNRPLARPAPAPTPVLEAIEVVFGQTATLAVGQDALYEGDLRVTLKQINDSRCPKDVACIWAGELAGVFWISGGDIGAEPVEMILGETTKPTLTLESYVFALTGITETSATISVALCDSCGVAQEQASESGVTGVAMLGPTCPVMTDPPDPSCADRPYQGTFEIVSRTGAGGLAVSTDASGSFSAKLAPGDYTITLVNESAMPSMSPTDFTVVAGEWTELTLSLDSGIR